MANNATRVLACTCEHEYQDEKYGKRNRLHNPCKETAGRVSWRCTVCGAERDKAPVTP